MTTRKDSGAELQRPASMRTKVHVDVELQPFSYADVPLRRDSSQTRLIKIHPADSHNADLILELFIGDTDTDDFEALSWCWGDGAWDRPVRMRCPAPTPGDASACADRALRVSANLESALRHLRPGSEEEPRVVWVDAISIDQADAEEKSRQVPFMTEIYSSAQGVCVWLGDADESSRRAMRFVVEELPSLQKFDELCEKPEYTVAWKAVIQFMERPWFSRRWVIQEIAESEQNLAIVMCGSDTISWQKFAVSVSLLDAAFHGPYNLSQRLFPEIYKMGFSSDRYAPALGAIRLVKATHEIFDRNHHGEGRPSPRRSLEFLVSNFTMFETTEPRDIVFSLLSISNDAFRLQETVETVEAPQEVYEHIPHALRNVKSWYEKHRVRRAFRVDYVAPVYQVYKQFVSFTIAKANPSKALDIICRPWAPEVPDEVFPTWISTVRKGAFRLERTSRMGDKLTRYNADPLVGDTDVSIYNASGKLTIGRGFTIFRYWNTMDHSMFLRGFILDRFSELKQVARVGHLPYEWKPDNWDLESDPPEEFWRTIIADRDWDGAEPPLYYPDTCRTVYQQMRAGVDVSRLINNSSCVIQTFLQRVQEAIWNRRLARTARERLCLAPHNARPDDLICVLYGLSVPVVLRRHRKTSSQMAAEAADDAARRRNPAEYIARKIAAAARRRRQAKAQGQSPIKIRSEAARTPHQAYSQLRWDTSSASDETSVLGGMIAEPPKRVASGPDSFNEPSKRVKAVAAASSAAASRQNSGFEKGGSGGGMPRRSESAPGVEAKGDAPNAFYYTLVGECYVQGMMQGEAVRFRARNNAGKMDFGDRIMTQEFELR